MNRNEAKKIILSREFGLSGVINSIEDSYWEDIVDLLYDNNYEIKSTEPMSNIELTKILDKISKEKKQ